ncbi:hypothetical protein BKA65DRAFT_515117 [Rhexocercosporidium sp. MPI-PUGE-AT-0058]|nr:hypothetical protein BKA65DRAFT_515117 [Rhexocercosporidium sp. MPI-PUGE-AT-0058]
MNKARQTCLEHTGVKNGLLSYLHMTRLATKPEYQRHGIGGALSQWGLDVAQKHNLLVGLFSTLVARPLYGHLGFETLKEIIVQIEGEKEKVEMTCTKWDSKS